jgi:hypothetical protein
MESHIGTAKVRADYSQKEVTELPDASNLAARSQLSAYSSQAPPQTIHKSRKEPSSLPQPHSSGSASSKHVAAMRRPENRSNMSHLGHSSRLERSSLLKNLSTHASTYTLVHDLYTPHRSYIFSEKRPQATTLTLERVASAERRQQLIDAYHDKFKKHRERMSQRRAPSEYPRPKAGTMEREAEADWAMHWGTFDDQKVAENNARAGAAMYEDYCMNMSMGDYPHALALSPSQVNSNSMPNPTSATGASKQGIAGPNSKAHYSDHQRMLSLLGLMDGGMPNDLTGPFRADKAFGPPMPSIKQVSTFEDYLERTVNAVRLSPVRFNKR